MQSKPPTGVVLKSREKGGWLAAVVALAWLCLAAAPAVATAEPACEQVTDDFASAHSQADSDFLVKQETIPYGAGSVTLARDCDGTDSLNVDDGIVVEVRRADGSTSSFSHDFSNGCSGAVTDAGPFDLTSHFRPGENAVTVRFRDGCGQGGSGTSSVYLVYETAKCDGRQVTTPPGDSNNNTMLGTSGADVVNGLGADDTISGFQGNDRLCGSGGDDILFGGGGDDLASDGRDRLFGAGGADTLSGGDRGDFLFGASGKDRDLDAGPGNDFVNAGGGADKKVFGRGGKDELKGGGGNDVLRGNAGNDDLSGGPGAHDKCIGGGGTDTADESCEIVSGVELLPLEPL